MNVQAINRVRWRTLPINWSQHPDLYFEADIPTIGLIYFEKVGWSGCLLHLGQSVSNRPLLDGRLRVSLLNTLVKSALTCSILRVLALLIPVQLDHYKIHSAGLGGH